MKALLFLTAILLTVSCGEKKSLNGSSAAVRRDSADAYSESNIAPGDAGPNGGFNEAWSPDLMSQNAPTGGYYPL